ncbi:hypothetical protein GEMRC1_001550 [Eukaryota sp. GEM-RC1]
MLDVPPNIFRNSTKFPNGTKSGRLFISNEFLKPVHIQSFECGLPRSNYVGKLTTDLVDDIVDQCQSRMLATNGNGSSAMTTFHGDHYPSPSPSHRCCSPGSGRHLRGF